jgi:hypothetical protein
MTDTLRPAAAEEITTSISFALCYDGRKRVHHPDEAVARITDERLPRHLEASRFVLMKRACGRRRQPQICRQVFGGKQSPLFHPLRKLMRLRE